MRSLAVAQIDPAYVATRWSQPEIRGYCAVLRAVLDQAIEDYRRARLHHQRTGRWTRAGAAARDWLFGVPTEPLQGLTLERLCDLLRLDADRIRRHAAAGAIRPRGERRHFARGSRADRALSRRWGRRREAYELKSSTRESGRRSQPESRFDDAAY